MEHLELYDEVIASFQDEYNFRRYTVTTSDIGREIRTTTDFKATAMVRPISTMDLTRVDKQGSHYEDGVKVIFRNNGSVDIKLNDLVLFGGIHYRLTNVRNIVVSDFTVMLGEMVKERNA